MGEHQIKWFASMRKKLGVKTDEEVREHMRKVGLKGKKTGKGGFYHMAKNNPEKLREISRKGGNRSNVVEHR